MERCRPRPTTGAACAAAADARRRAMHLVAFVVALALIEFFVFGMLVGRARGTYGVALGGLIGAALAAPN